MGEHRWTRAEGAWAGALALCVAGALVAWRASWGLWGALGTDAPLWGLTARDLSVGAAPLVPPGYPSAIRVLHAVGLDLVSAGVTVSVAGGAALAAVGALVLRRAGAGRGLASLGGALAVAMPDVVAWSEQLQPDALAAALILLLGGLLGAVARGSSPAAWGAAVLAGLLPLVREHGLPLLAIAAAVLATRRQWRPLLALGVVWWLGPLVVGLAPGMHPLDVAWADRAGGPLDVFRATRPDQIPYLHELHREDRRAYLTLLEQQDRLGQLRWHMGRSLALAGDLWAWCGVAVVAALVSARRAPALLALAAPLAAALPALVVWSERRHVGLLAPLAVVVLWSAAAAWGRRGVVAGALLTGVLANGWPGQWAAIGRGQQTERLRAEHFAELGRWLAANAPEHSLLGGVFQDVGLYCPLPRHDPDGTAADWSTFLVTDRPPPRSPWGRWERVHSVGAEPDRPQAGMGIFRLDPQRHPRPCGGIAPAEGAAHLAIARAHVELPGCVVTADDPPR